MSKVEPLGTFAPFYGTPSCSGPTSVGPFAFNQPGAPMPMEMILLPGFRDDFDAMPQSACAEFKENCRTDQIGRLVNGKFTQRLRGRRLTEVRTYECLVGMKKMYLDHAQYRIIFQQSGNAVVLIAAGERRDMLVYKRARDRVQLLIAQQSQSTP